MTVIERDSLGEARVRRRTAERSEARARRVATWRRAGVFWLWLMLAPALIWLAIFQYLPMFGVVMAFQDFNPLWGFVKSPWVGLDNFRLLFMLPDLKELIRNTIVIAMGKIFFGKLAALIFAILFNELRERWKLFRRTIQTLVYIPHFISWVIIGGIMMDMLGAGGIVSQAIKSVGFERAPGFLSDPQVFPWTLIFSEVWKDFGWGAIVYLAAIVGIGQEIYEAAAVDGASRWQKIWHITIPGLMPMVMLTVILSIGGILNAGLSQILFLYNPAVYATGDVLDTYVYRVGIQSAQWSFASAVQLIKSTIGFVLMLISWYLANKYSGWRPF
ncbi:MAG: ABC transporter permease [Anaerolineae bacterium]